MSLTEAMRPHLDRLQSRALIAGVAGTAACLAGLAVNAEQFYRSYLMGFIFWMGVVAGSVGLLMLHHMVGGNWGVAIRRGLEASTRTLPLMILLFLPIATFGLHHLYEWTHAEVVAKDPVLRHKSAYLNPAAFYVRAILYFAIWMGLTALLNKYSREQEREGYWAVRPRLQRLSAPGLIAHCLVVTFASVDWVMSLEPHWYSTIYGAIFIANQAMSTFAVMITLLCMFESKSPMQGLVKTQTFHDLGNLLFAFNLFWAYVSVSQLIIVWSANLPEEITWYVRRLRGGWEYVGLAVAVFHFALVFLLLLMRKIKRNPRLLQKVAMWVIFMRLVDMFWVIQPAFGHGVENGAPVSHFHFHWLDVAAPVAVGGLWVAFLAFQLKRRPLEPLALG